MRMNSPAPKRGRSLFLQNLPLGMASLCLALLSSCGSVDLSDGASLSSSSNLGPQSGRLTKERTFVDSSAVLSARTVAIAPASFTAIAAGRVKKHEDRELVINALSRAICVALSDKYTIVAYGQTADLTVKTTVTKLVPTGKTAAGVSAALSLGANFVLPVGVPRLPVGLGAIAVEGEALDATGVQRAAIIWSRGANSITSSPRVSEIGDAYSLAASFGADFSTMIKKGKPPAMLDVEAPSGQRIKSYFGGKPKYAACDAFGRAPGVPGMVAGMVGAPPGWTDKSGAQKPAAPAN